MPYPEFYWPWYHPVEIQPFDAGVNFQTYDSGITKSTYPFSKIRTRLSFRVTHTWQDKVKALYDFYRKVGGGGSPFFIADPYLSLVGDGLASDKPTEGKEWLAFADGAGPYLLSRQNVVPDSEVVYVNGTSLTGAQEVVNGDFSSGLTGWTQTPAADCSITAETSHSRDSGYCVRIRNRGIGAKFSSISRTGIALDNNSFYRIGAWVKITEDQVPTDGVVVGVLATATNLPVPSHTGYSTTANLTTKVGRYQYIETVVSTGVHAYNADIKVRLGIQSNYSAGDLLTEAECYVDSITIRKLDYTFDRTTGSVTFLSAPTNDDELEIDYQWYRKVVFVEPDLKLSEFSTRVFDLGLAVEEAF